MTCPSTPDLNLHEWAETLFSRMDGKRFPLTGTIELTDRCNLNCVHCYINQPAGSGVELAQELNTEEWKAVIDEIADAGCLYLLITGGDPLLRPDFAEVYLHAKRRGMLITIFTNATLITDKIANLLAAYPPQIVDVTLYGATAETYEAVTRVKGSFERALQGLQRLKERNIRIGLKTILLTINKQDLPALKALAEEYEVDFRYDGLIWPRRDSDKEPLQYRLSSDELLDLELREPEIVEAWQALAKEFEGTLGRKDFVFNCGAGIKSFHINKKGQVTICTMVPRPIFDLKEMRFLQAWEKIGDLRKMKRKMNTKCETCTVNGLCVQCPGWSLASHGDFETPDEFVCELGTKRALRINQLLL